MPRSARSFIRSQEIAHLLTHAGRRKFYYACYRQKIEGAKQSPSRWGYIVPRRGFLKWLAENPNCRAESPSAPTSAVNVHRDEPSSKEQSRENQSSGNHPAS